MVQHSQAQAGQRCDRLLELGLGSGEEGEEEVTRLPACPAPNDGLRTMNAFRSSGSLTSNSTTLAPASLA